MSNSKNYRAEVFGDSDCIKIPSVAVFSISEETAHEIVELSTLVKSHELHKVEKFDYRADFLKFDPETQPAEAKKAGKGNEVSTEGNCLNVSGTEFWFTATLKEADIEVSTALQPIADLMSHFGFGPAAVTSANDEVPVGTPGNLVTLDGVSIQGTLESLNGVSGLMSVTRKEDGTLDFAYDGTTEIWWNGQETVRTSAGEVIFITEDDKEVPASQVKLVLADAE